MVVASPTYKASYTGLLKLFLDRIGRGALTGVTAVPLMLGGDLRHTLAPEVFLKPVLVELGASCPTAGLFLPESDFAGSDALDIWVERASILVKALLLRWRSAKARTSEKASHGAGASAPTLRAFDLMIVYPSSSWSLGPPLGGPGRTSSLHTIGRENTWFV